MQDPVSLLEPSAGLMAYTLLIVGVVVAIPVYFLVRFLRAHARRSARMSAAHPTLSNVDALEAEVAQLRTDVTNLELGQEFTTQLLTERSAASAISVQKSREQLATRHDKQMETRDHPPRDAT